MFTIDGLTFRNLQEQVGKNKDDISMIELFKQLVDIGVTLKGFVEKQENLPATANDGDCYGVGTDWPYLYFAYVDTSWKAIGIFPLSGPQGISGVSTSVSVGSTTQVESNKPARVYNSGTKDNVILNFDIPAGKNGVDGFTPTISIGSVKSGEVADVSNVGTPRNAIFNFTLPRGSKGEKGDPGSFIHIIGELENESQLPDPKTLNDLTGAYLVGAEKNVYMQIGDSIETAVWYNLGTLNLGTYCTVDGQFIGIFDLDTKQNKIAYLNLNDSVPNSATSGTLTQAQLDLLQNGNLNFIIFNNEQYYPMDKSTVNGYLVYTHCGLDTTQTTTVKCISINLSTLAWTLTTTQVPSSYKTINGESIIGEGNIVVQGGGDLQMDLLWENSSPTSEFTAQTVTIEDMSEYKILMFVVFQYVYQSASSTSIQSYLMPIIIGKSTTMSFPAWLDTGATTYYRTATIDTNTTISFENGTYLNSATSIGSDSTKVIPYQIYGIK